LVMDNQIHNNRNIGLIIINPNKDSKKSIVRFKKNLYITKHDSLV